MSRTESPSTAKPYGLARVTAVWGLPRSTYYARRHRLNHPVESRKRGPPNGVDRRGADRADPRADRPPLPLVAKGTERCGHACGWQGSAARKPGVLRLMRQAQLLAPQRLAVPVVEKTHSGTITTDRPNRMWGHRRHGNGHPRRRPGHRLRCR